MAKSPTQTITVPAGTQYRTIPRGEKAAVTRTLSETLTIPAENVTLSFADRNLRVIAAFQYKGRRATVKLRKVTRNA